MALDTFKAGDTDYEAIILPFQSRWHDPVVAGQIGAVFRKKGPAAQATPKWIYAYFGSPISAICAKIELEAIKQVPIDKAVKYCESGMLTEAKLRKYVGNSPSLFVFEIGQCLLPNQPLELDELTQRFGYQPTPSFVALSREGWRQLDRALGFSRNKQVGKTTK